jgi:hypothetical protein
MLFFAISKYFLQQIKNNNYYFNPLLLLVDFPYILSQGLDAYSTIAMFWQ